MRKIAQLISAIFNPLTFLLVIPYIVVHSQNVSRLYAVKWTLFTAAFVLIAIVFIIIGRAMRLFSDFDISKQEERWRLYIFSWILAVFYLSCSIFFKGIFFPLSILSFGLVIGIFVFTIINRYIKASIHMAFACAFVITVSVLWKGEWFLYVAWIIPTLAWARFLLKKHSLEEIFIGSFLGTAITAITFLLGWYLYYA